MRLLLELYCGVVIKHVALFPICVKLTTAFTFTSLLLNYYTSVSESGCGFGIEQKYWRIDGFGEKKSGHGSANLHTPIQSPLSSWLRNFSKICTLRLRPRSRYVKLAFFKFPRVKEDFRKVSFSKVRRQESRPLLCSAPSRAKRDSRHARSRLVRRSQFYTVCGPSIRLFSRF